MTQIFKYSMKHKQRVCFSLFTAGFFLLMLTAIHIMRPEEGDILNNTKVVFNLRPEVHITAKKNKLNKSNQTNKEEEDIEVSHQYIEDTVNDSDPDVDLFLEKLFNYNRKMFDFHELRKITFEELVTEINYNIPHRQFLPAFKNRKGKFKNWQIFHRGIHRTRLYDPKYLNVDGLLKDLTNDRIVATELMDGGTQIKLLITFNNGCKALFKPCRFGRHVETIDDHFYFNDFERHNAEIAAFHLDWLMGFYRVSPTAGRKINMTSEIKNVADHHLRHNFYISPANNICFYGDCKYYCDTYHPLCGKPDMLEGSLAVFLPDDEVARRLTWRNPWRRAYSIRKKAYWEKHGDLCDFVKQNPLYMKGRRLLELIDMHIFDFLTGNMDRHHYETFFDFGNNTFYFHYDNGRGFGKTRHDEISILAPLYQCCEISYFTFLKLVKLYIGPQRLSDLMRKSLTKDSVHPILTEPHLTALDRRVPKILKEVFNCIQNGNDINDVIVERSW